MLSIFGKSDSDGLADNSLKKNINETSLVATVKSAVPPSINRTITQAPVQAYSGVEEKSGYYEFSGPLPAINVKSALAVDLDNGFEFLNLNASESRWPIASISKLMSAVIAFENVGSDKTVAINETALATEGVSGDLKIGLKLGDIYKVGDLVKIMLSISSNKAATAISDFYGKSNFVEAMQKKAFELEMSQTTFHDSTGLSFLNQSTATDLEKLINYILKRHPYILEITRAKTAAVSELRSGSVKTLANINNFSGRPDFVGGKTGFIDASGGNLVSVFNHKGHKILIVVFGADDRFSQTELLYNWITKEFKF